MKSIPVNITLFKSSFSRSAELTDQLIESIWYRSTTGKERLDHLTIFSIEYDFAAKVSSKFAAANIKNYAMKKYHIAF